MFDRVLAANTVGTLAALLLAVIGFLTGRPEFLDIAITYGLLNLIGTLAVLKFFRHGDLGDPGETRGGAPLMIAVVEIASWLLLVAGGFFCIVGGLGLVRMPDVYTRMHAPASPTRSASASCSSA